MVQSCCETLDEEKIVHILFATVHESEDRSLHHIVKLFYQRDKRIKDFIQHRMNTSVLALLRGHPHLFDVDLDNNSVSLAAQLPFITLEEISKHCSKDDAWIAVEGEVYNITEFVQTHWGWTSAGKDTFFVH